MNAMSVRKKRLEQLLELARTYKGCTRRDLARALGRDPTKLIPGTGVPKLDLVVELARVLDWPVGEVVAHLWDGVAAPQGREEGDFESINLAAGEAYRAGQYELVLELARRAYAAASTPQQRARACNREAGAWDGMARYQEALQATRRGLEEPGVAPEFRRMLQSNLANAYYCLWMLVESGAVARHLLESYEANPPQGTNDRKTEAFANYVAGHSARRLITLEPPMMAAHAGRASVHLERARDRYQALAEELADGSLAAIANTCRGGLIEVEIVLGRRTPAAALEELSAGLERVRDVAEPLPGGLLESYGWWCIFGCNIVMRHLTSEREVQQHMAVLTNKADEIAERLNNWSMRERVFSLQHASRERAASASGMDIPCVIDSNDVRIIAGTMGRFPAFRPIGWKILETAQVVNGK